MSEAGSTHGQLPEELGVGIALEAAAMLLELVTATADEPDLRLDASRVDHVDAAGLQLLISLRSELAIAGRSLCLSSISPALESALIMTGLAQQLSISARSA